MALLCVRGRWLPLLAQGPGAGFDPSGFLRRLGARLNLAIDTTRSPSCNWISLTPWELRPISRICDTDVRSICPLGHEHQFVIVGDMGDADDAAVAIGRLDVDEAHAATICSRTPRCRSASRSRSR